MYNQEVSKRTQELIEEYGQLLGNSSWKESLSIQEFLEIRKFAADELKNRIFDIDDKRNKAEKPKGIEVKTTCTTDILESNTNIQNDKQVKKNESIETSEYNPISKKETTITNFSKNEEKERKINKEDTRTKIEIKKEKNKVVENSSQTKFQSQSNNENESQNQNKKMENSIPTSNANLSEKEKRELALFNRLQD